jgi:hypothetical protein
VIRSGPEGAVVLQTEEGFEALRCSGFNETIVYPGIPEGLSAKPTLSVRTRSDRAASATVTLSYLAAGFDWQTNYVATLAPSEDRLDLFAWVTLANGDETSFVNASTQTVAGKVNREDFSQGPRAEGQELNLRCWPSGSTSDIEAGEEYRAGMPPPPPPPPPAPMMEAAQAITVTGSRISRKALQEELGDLKLYRVPDPVTVAAKSQKQVAMLDQPTVKVGVVYRLFVDALVPSQLNDVERVLVTKNRKAEGLGLPLPAGRLVLFGSGHQRPILLGEGFVDDKAVGEDVEIVIGPATGISTNAVLQEGSSGNGRSVELKVANDRNMPIKFEAEFNDQNKRISSSTKLGRRDGRSLWAVTVPANGTATLRYRTTRSN